MKLNVKTDITKKAGVIVYTVETDKGMFESVFDTYCDGSCAELIKAKTYYYGQCFSFERSFDASNGMADIRDYFKTVADGWYSLEYSFEDFAVELNERAEIMMMFAVVMEQLYNFREGL